MCLISLLPRQPLGSKHLAVTKAAVQFAGGDAQSVLGEGCQRGSGARLLAVRAVKV